MAGAATFPSYSLPRRTGSGLPYALLLSAAIHLLLASAVVREAPGGKVQLRAGEVLYVRLVPQPAAAPANGPLPERVMMPAPQRTRRAGPDSGREIREADRPALPQASDPTYYSARDLDVYPRPVAPLALDRIAAGNTEPVQVAVAVRIDEQGIVNEVSFPAPATPDRLRDELRALLAATRFTPAHKDGRAVKSRVVLDFSFGAANGRQ